MTKMKTEDLKPAALFGYFKEICAIPQTLRCLHLWPTGLST